MNAKTANLLCLLVAMIWGGGFIATDLALESFSPFSMLVCRFVGAAVLAWIPVLIKKEKIHRKDLIAGSASGILLYAAFAFQTFGLTMTGPGMNAFLTSVNVVFVPYIVWVVLRRKPDGVILAASLICLAGIGCLSLSGGSFSFGMGDVLSLICAFFFAAQIVALEYAQGSSPTVINAIQLSCAGILSIPFGIGAAWPHTLDMTDVLSILYSIVLATFVCYLLQTVAQQYTSAAAASILLCTESLWANIFSFMLLHEAKTPVMILGGLLIFASVILVEGRSLLPKAQLEPLASEPASD